MPEVLGSGSNGVAFLVAAGVMYECIAAACSSPQTVEINASTRAVTLMKWVNLGIGQGALFVIAAAIIDKRNSGAILAGGITAGVLMYMQYVHARTAGLRSSEPGTEDLCCSPQ